MRLRAFGDPLFRLVDRAYDAVHHLSVHVHYLSCGSGVGTSPRATAATATASGRPISAGVGLSRAAWYAVAAVARLATAAGRPVSAQELARAGGFPEPFLFRLFGQLAGAGG